MLAVEDNLIYFNLASFVRSLASKAMSWCIIVGKGRYKRKRGMACLCNAMQILYQLFEICDKGTFLFRVFSFKLCYHEFK